MEMEIEENAKEESVLSYHLESVIAEQAVSEQQAVFEQQVEHLLEDNTVDELLFEQDAACDWEEREHNLAMKPPADKCQNFGCPNEVSDGQQICSSCEIDTRRYTNPIPSGFTGWNMPL